MNRLSRKTVNLVKNFSWEDRVHRLGFLQSKDICNEAEILPIELIKGIVAKYNNVFWVGDINLYDDKATKSFLGKFEKAFSKQKYWPRNVFKRLGVADREVNKFINVIKKRKYSISAFLKYVELLKKIQRYYVIAVPLTNYAEQCLAEYPQIIKEYAVPYQKLEMDSVSSSKNPAKEYAWINTAYNIIGKTKSTDFSGHYIAAGRKKSITRLPEDIRYLIEALQIGIYLRNRMKELAQKLWYYIDPLAQKLAQDLNITRDEFFYLTYREVLRSYRQKKLCISKKELADRKTLFAVGLLNRKKYLLTGAEAKELLKYFSQPRTNAMAVSGKVGFKGLVRGKTRVVFNKENFLSFQKGDILVTSMTTPDFIALMTKAGAIVTDEGGLSCHAAIIARELKKPCVIGTKIATKVFKNGDLVEVDANKGIVRKL